MYFSAGLRSFYTPCSKKFGLNIWVTILIQRYAYTSGYDTVSYNNLATMLFVHRLSQIIWDKVFKNGPSKICGTAILQIF